jgi:hypothetical protein
LPAPGSAVVSAVVALALPVSVLVVALAEDRVVEEDDVGVS